MISYLDRLPEQLKRPGNAAAGEIELQSVADHEAEFGVVYEDNYFLVVQDRVKFPSGRIGGYGRVIERASLTGISGTVMIPVVADQIVFVQIFRHATRQWEWELPRGYQEPDVSAEDNARREIVEELGVAPVRVELVGSVKPNTGLLSTEVSVYFTRLPNDFARLQPADPDEGIGRIRLVQYDDINNFLLKNVTCGFSLSGILLARLNKLIP